MPWKLVGSKGISPPFLTSALRIDERLGRFASRVPIEQEAEWAAEPVSTLWKKERFGVAAENWDLAVQHAARHYTDWSTPASSN
jgi:hypothetical protein